jgi:hypothetical protein
MSVTNSVPDVKVIMSVTNCTGREGHYVCDLQCASLEGHYVWLTAYQSWRSLSVTNSVPVIKVIMSVWQCTSQLGYPLFFVNVEESRPQTVTLADDFLWVSSDFPTEWRDSALK